MRWAGHVACMREERGVYRVLLGKPKGSGTLMPFLKVSINEISFSSILDAVIFGYLLG